MSSVSMLYQRQSRVLEFGFAVFCVLMAGYNLFFSTPYYCVSIFVRIALSFCSANCREGVKFKRGLSAAFDHPSVYFIYLWDWNDL